MTRKPLWFYEALVVWEPGSSSPDKGLEANYKYEIGEKENIDYHATITFARAPIETEIIHKWEKKEIRLNLVI